MTVSGDDNEIDDESRAYSGSRLRARIVSSSMCDATIIKSNQSFQFYTKRGQICSTKISSTCIL